MPNKEGQQYITQKDFTILTLLPIKAITLQEMAVEEMKIVITGLRAELMM